MSALDPLSDEQREIRELVRTIARERVAPRAAEIDKSAEFPWDVVEVFRDNDLFGVDHGPQPTADPTHLSRHLCPVMLPQQSLVKDHIQEEP